MVYLTQFFDMKKKKKIKIKHNSVETYVNEFQTRPGWADLFKERAACQKP